MHGSGEKGDDGEKQVHVGLANVVRERARDFPAIVVFPQIPKAGQVATHAAPIARLVDSVVREVHGDPAHLYLTGLSFGGVLTYLVARERPDHFAALVQISAPLVIQPGDRSTRLAPAAAGSDEARVLHGTRVWIYQGARDRNVPARGDARGGAGAEGRGRLGALHRVPRRRPRHLGSRVPRPRAVSLALRSAPLTIQPL